MDKFKKILVIFILIIIGFFAVYGAINISSKFNVKSDSTITPQNEKNNSNLSYSFVDDDDNDGLSNAKEIIYGSDSNDPDTDKDSYPDGDEVKNGYDPVVAGSGRLTDRTTQNLTIQYFSWVKEKYNINDPILRDSSIKEYLNIYYPIISILPDIAENKLTINNDADNQDLINYIESLNNIELPQGLLDHQELYEKILNGQLVDIDSILNELNASADKLYKLTVPKKALEIHKKYIGIVETLKIIFTDLKNARKDPVLIQYNIKKGQELAIIAADLEEEKINILKQ
ncbi:MAG: thrombospondin type 3 repeat-containing protein [Patescibacteria group bacterium]